MSLLYRYVLVFFVIGVYGLRTISINFQTFVYTDLSIINSPINMLYEKINQLVLLTTIHNNLKYTQQFTVTLKCSQQLKLFVIKFKLLDTLSKVYDGIDKSCLRCSHI